jgi:hypothetical protein
MWKKNSSDWAKLFWSILLFNWRFFRSNLYGAIKMPIRTNIWFLKQVKKIHVFSETFWFDGMWSLINSKFDLGLVFSFFLYVSWVLLKKYYNLSVPFYWSRLTCIDCKLEKWWKTIVFQLLMLNFFWKNNL